MALTTVLLKRPPSLSDLQVRLLSRHLSPTERDRHASLTEPDRAETFLLGRAIARWLIGRHLGVAPQTVPITMPRSGKPRIITRDNGASLDFSLAHCRSHVFVGITEVGAIGVDVEVVRPLDPHVVTRTLTQQELVMMEQLDRGERAAAFTQLWTVKEACLKVSGRPLAGAWRSVSATLDPEGSCGDIRWKTLPLGGELAATVALGPRC